jgi:hypothetical protein
MEQKFGKYLKETFSAVKYSPKAYFCGLFFEIYDTFFKVFIGVIIANVIVAIGVSDIENIKFWAYIFLVLTIIRIIFAHVLDLIIPILH